MKLISQEYKIKIIDNFSILHIINIRLIFEFIELDNLSSDIINQTRSFI